jgi:pimeloyl-ACP methyl ester carboxylesterase
VGALIDTLDLRDVTPVAHDLGGPAGLAAAAARPERFRGVVAVNTFAWRPPAQLARPPRDPAP